MRKTGLIRNVKISDTTGLPDLNIATPNPLVAYYPLRGSHWTSYSRDISGNNRNLLYAMYLKFGQSGRFNLPENSIQNSYYQGFIDFGHVPFSFQMVKTVCFWVNMQNSYGYFVCFGGNGAAVNWATIHYYNNNVYCVYSSNRIGESFSGIKVEGFSKNNWHHIVAVFGERVYKSTKGFKIYIDGKLKKNIPIEFKFNTTARWTDGGCLFNYRHLNRNYGMIGKMEKLRIYNRELTQSEILALYHEQP